MTLLARLATYRRTRAARGATEAETELLTELLEHLDSLEEASRRRAGLARELEMELFGEVIPLQPDGGESVTARAVGILRAWKRERQELRDLAREASRTDSTASAVRAARDELVRVAGEVGG